VVLLFLQFANKSGEPCARYKYIHGISVALLVESKRIISVNCFVFFHPFLPRRKENEIVTVIHTHAYKRKAYSRH